MASATELWLGAGGFGLELGSLESAGDQDVFQVVIEEGGVTPFLVNRLDEDLDTTLAVFDAEGDPIGQNDDFAGTTDSQLSLNLESGVYYVSIAWHDDVGTGDYVVKVSPLDVLGIINYLNDDSAWRSADASSPREDVNGDGTVSPMDVLMVINYLNVPATDAGSSSAGGEDSRSARSRSTGLPSGVVAQGTSTGRVLSPRSSGIAFDVAKSGNEPDVTDRGRVVDMAYGGHHDSARSADIDLAMASDADWLGEQQWADALSLRLA